jgi:general stress protein 26
MRIAMLTTVAADGKLISRPMATRDATCDGALWFITKASAPKVEQADRDQQVGVRFAKPDADRFSALAGTEQMAHDRRRIDDYWNGVLSAWFGNGTNYPDLALLKVAVEGADIWEGLANPVSRFVGLAKGAATRHDDQGQWQKPGLTHS